MSPRSGDLSHPYVRGKVVVVWRPSGPPTVPGSLSGLIDEYLLDPASQLTPKTADQIGTVVWLDCRAAATGESYSNGKAAYAADCEVTVIDKTTNTIVGKKSFRRGPPLSISSESEGVASAPTEEFAKYLEGLPTKPYSAPKAAAGLHWGELSPRNNSEDSFIAVDFLDGDHGWVAELGGDILATTDGGATWSAQKSGTDRNLQDVAFADASHGWAVGGGSGDINAKDSTVIHTSDGGARWQLQKTGTQEILHAVAVADALHAWAVGDAGTIVSTVDGGEHWSAQSSHTTMSLYGVASADAMHAWAVGSKGTVLATTDGGATWSAQDVGTDRDLMDVTFIDADHGWAVGWANAVLATTDGGATWRAQDAGPGTAFYGVDFTDANHGWVVGGRTIVNTTDGGANWNALQTVNPLPDLRDVSFPDPTHGWAVGNNVFVAKGGGQ